MIFVRIDKDGVPDAQSYYDTPNPYYDLENDDVEFISRFDSLDRAVLHLSQTYGREATDWLRKNIVETEPGVWGLPTAPGILFGFNLESLLDEGVAALTAYIKDGYYFQVWEGIWVSDYSPARKALPEDGDQFIPIKLLQSWWIDIEAAERMDDSILMDWISDDSKLLAPPWEGL